MSLEFFNTTCPVARKEHKCSMCGKTIIVGEKYHRHSGKFDGVFFDDCDCEDCISCITDYCNYWGVCVYDVDGVYDYLRDRFCEDCPHYFKSDKAVDDCEESVWHCAMIQNKLNKEN